MQTPASDPTAVTGISDTVPVVVERISYDGQLGVRARVPSGIGTCIGPPVAVGFENDYTVLKVNGTGFETNATLTWSTQNPAAQNLVLVVCFEESCGPGCFMWSGVEAVRGGSPLQLEYSKAEVDGRFFINVAVDDVDLPRCIRPIPFLSISIWKGRCRSLGP